MALRMSSMCSLCVVWKLMGFSSHWVHCVGWLTFIHQVEQGSQNKDKICDQYVTFISQGDYDVVINDYEKAKSLFGNTEVPVFKKGNFFLFCRSQISQNIAIYCVIFVPLLQCTPRLRPGFRHWGISCWRNCCRLHPRCMTRSDTSGLFSVPTLGQLFYYLSFFLSIFLSSSPLLFSPVFLASLIYYCSDKPVMIT